MATKMKLRVSCMSLDSHMGIVSSSTGTSNFVLSSFRVRVVLLLGAVRTFVAALSFIASGVHPFKSVDATNIFLPMSDIRDAPVSFPLSCPRKGTHKDLANKLFRRGQNDLPARTKPHLFYPKA